MAARFEIRQLDLPSARKILGNGIGMCPKEALFKGYIQLEMDVRPLSVFIHALPNKRLVTGIRPSSSTLRKISRGMLQVTRVHRLGLLTQLVHSMTQRIPLHGSNMQSLRQRWKILPVQKLSSNSESPSRHLRCQRSYGKHTSTSRLMNKVIGRRHGRCMNVLFH